MRSMTQGGLLRAVLVAFGFVAFCTAMAPPEGQQVPKEEPRQLSTLLPPRLAEWIQKTGRDRSIDGETAQQVLDFYAERADISGKRLLALFEPTEQETIIAPVTVIDAVDETPRLVTVTPTFVNGALIPAGEVVFVGDEIGRGWVLNAGDGDITVQRGSQSQPIVLGPGEILATSCQPCSVLCRDTAYACCDIDRHGCCTCHCVPNNKTATCASGGGPASASCSCGATEQLP